MKNLLKIQEVFIWFELELNALRFRLYALGFYRSSVIMVMPVVAIVPMIAMMVVPVMCMPVIITMHMVHRRSWRVVYTMMGR